MRGSFHPDNSQQILKNKKAPMIYRSPLTI